MACSAPGLPVHPCVRHEELDAARLDAKADRALCVPLSCSIVLVWEGSAACGLLQTCWWGGIACALPVSRLLASPEACEAPWQAKQCLHGLWWERAAASCTLRLC